MENGSKSPIATALREAGYQPLPRLWVTAEQMDLILWMVKQNQDDVNRIRREVEINLAWEKQRDSEC